MTVATNIASREALAVYGVKKLVARYACRLHELVEKGASVEALGTAVENLAAAGGRVTFAELVAIGHGVRCDDCGVDVAPCDEDGYAIEGTGEMYMVHRAVL